MNVFITLILGLLALAVIRGVLWLAGTAAHRLGFLTDLDTIAAGLWGLVLTACAIAIVLLAGLAVRRALTPQGSAPRTDPHVTSPMFCSSWPSQSTRRAQSASPYSARMATAMSTSSMPTRRMYARKTAAISLSLSSRALLGACAIRSDVRASYKAALARVGAGVVRSIYRLQVVVGVGHGSGGFSHAGPLLLPASRGVVAARNRVIAYPSCGLRST